MKLKRNITLFLKGTAVGAVSAVPGLSGGTAAVILGVYEDMLSSASHLFGDFKNSFFFLLPTVSGAGIGLYAVSIPLDLFCKSAPILAYSLFFVITSASSYLFATKSVGGKIALKKSVFFLIGAVGSVGMMIAMREFDMRIETPLGLFFAGLPLAAALVLPAISFSYMLLFFGLYERVLDSIVKFDTAFILPLALGTVIFTFLVCAVLNKLIERFREQTYCIITGFVFASLYDLIRTIYEMLTNH